MKILVALENAEILRIIGFSLESQMKDVTSIQSASLRESILALKDHPDIELIVCEGTDKPGSLVKYINDNRIKVPVLICVLNEQQKTGTFGLRKVVGIAQGKKLVEDLITHIKNFRVELEKSEKSAAAPKSGVAAGASNQAAPAATTASVTKDGRKEADFCRINTNLLLRVSPLKSDIYIRLSATKFVKLFQEGDTFDAGDLEKYLKQKKVDYFYLLAAEAGEFASKLKDDLLALISTASPKDLAKVGPEISESVHESVKELIQGMGVTKEVQEIVKANMQLAMKTMAKSPKLSMIVDRIKRDPSKYISSHSMMLGEIACGIATAAGWHSETTFYKLNLAAFLHDITLKSNELATIQTLDELEARKLEFTPADLQAYRDHPLAAAELAKQFTEVPPDVDVIVAQHHELPDGKGFPRGLTHTTISPLAATFMVAHELLLFILRHEHGWTMDEFIDTVKDKYSSGNFKKIIRMMAEQNKG